MGGRAVLLSALAGSVFLASVAGKVVRPAATFQVLDALAGVKDSAASDAFVGLVAVETILWCWLFAGLARGLALTVAAALVLGLCAVPVALLVSGSELACECGVPVMSGDPRIEQIAALTRNVLLLFVLLPRGRR